MRAWATRWNESTGAENGISTRAWMMEGIEWPHGCFMRSIPPAVRVLPMDSKEEPGFVGSSIEEVQQQYFLNELLRPDRPPGKFHYHKLGLRAEPGAVVLFQYGGRIIASAVLVGVERFKATERGRFGGAFQLEAKSIRVFDPVDAAAMRKIWPQVTRARRRADRKRRPGGRCALATLCVDQPPRRPTGLDRRPPKLVATRHRSSKRLSALTWCTFLAALASQPVRSAAIESNSGT